MSKIPSPFDRTKWASPHVSRHQAVTLPTLYDELSPEERQLVRKRYTELQKGCCYYCGEPLEETPAKEVFEHRINWRLFPENFLQHPIHLHHSHENGMTLGVVHALCNAVLFQVHEE